GIELDAEVAIPLLLVRVKVIAGQREPVPKVDLERRIGGLALTLSGDVVQADILTAHEHTIGLPVTVHVDTTVWILHDPGRNRHAVPRPQEPVVSARACRVLSVEDNAILVKALVCVHPRGVRVITGKLQTPATIGVVRDETACLRSSLFSGVSAFTVGGIAIGESMRQIPGPKGVQIERT